MYGYGVGGLTTAADKPQLAYLNERFEASGYRVPDLLRAIALSPAFGNVAESPAVPTPATTTASLAASGSVAQ